MRSDQRSAPKTTPFVMPVSPIFSSNSKNERHEFTDSRELFCRVQGSSKALKRKQKLLIADDDVPMRRMAAELLRANGYDVTEASNGKEALAQAKALKPDIVLTELVMPEVEGLQLIQELLQFDPRITIVAISGTFRADTYLRVASALGAKATLHKPLTGDALLRAVQQVSDTLESSD